MNLFLTVVTFFALMVSSVFIFFNQGKGKVGFYKYFIVVFLLGIIHLALFTVANLLQAEELYLRFSLSLGLLYGPTLAILFDRLKGKKRMLYDGLHFVPFLIGIFICFVIVLNPSFRYAYSYVSVIALCFFSLLHLLSYLVLLKREMFKMKVHSVKESVVLQIMWYVVMTLLFAAQLFLINSAVMGSDSIAVYHSFSSLLCILFFVGMLFLFSSFSRSKTKVKVAVGTENESTSTNRKLDGIKKSIVKRSRFVTHPITVLQEVEYRKKIDHFIQACAYLDSEVNKENFSRDYAIPYHAITPFLKREFGRGFHSFVNQLRLNYAAKQLRSDGVVSTMTDLSIVCGFSSRASFYRNFQAEFGCSPHQFRTDNLDDLSVC